MQTELQQPSADNASDDSARPLAGRRYTLLLAMLVTSLVLQSIDAPPGPRALAADTFTSGLAVATFVVVFGRPRERAWVAATLVALLALGWARYVFGATPAHPLAVAYHAVMAVFLWVAVAEILRQIFRPHASGGENLRGAICGYLIAGSAWASVNALAWLIVPAAYAFDGKVAPLLADWHGRTALFAYYSYAQMLTIGYADVTPVRAPATTLALFASLFGVFYTAVVVAQLVGVAQAARRGPAERD